MKKAKEKSKKMLAYSKNVLNKMSFDVILFKKELTKACKHLLEEEIEDLMKWVVENFGKQYMQTCTRKLEVFNQSSKALALK